MCHTANQHREHLENSVHLDTLEGFDNRHRRVLKRAHTRQNGECIWCGRETFLWWEITTNEFIKLGKQKLATREHMTPKSHGGDNTDSNITCACHRCNSLRGTIPEDHFKWVTSTPKRLKRLLQLKQDKRTERNRLKRANKERHQAMMLANGHRKQQKHQAKMEKIAISTEQTENRRLIKYASRKRHERKKMKDIRTFTRHRNEQQEWGHHHGLIKFARRQRFEHHNNIRSQRAYNVVLLNYMLWRYPPCQEPVKSYQKKVEVLSFVAKVKRFFVKANLKMENLKHVRHLCALPSIKLTTGEKLVDSA